MSSTQEQQQAPGHIDTTAASDQPITIPAPAASPQLEKDAARAMKSADSWKPSLARTQSFNKEEQKRDLQMTGLGSVKSGPGFSEK
ncbi:hypothetical protein PG990_010463 [Apiospora arundinis]